MAETTSEELLVPHSLSTRLTVGSASVGLEYLLKGKVPPPRRRESMSQLAEILEHNDQGLHGPEEAIQPGIDFGFLLAANAGTNNAGISVLSSTLRSSAALLRTLSAGVRDVDIDEVRALAAFLRSLEGQLASAAAQPTDVAVTY